MSENIFDDDECELCGAIIPDNPSGNLCDIYILKLDIPGEDDFLWTCLSCCISNRELASVSSLTDIKEFLRK